MNENNTPQAEPLWYMQRLINYMAQPFDEAKGKEFQLTLSQFRVMRTIATFPTITAQQVSNYEGFNSMLVSRAVTALVKRDLVVRRVNSADKRRLKLNLTDKGQHIFHQILPSMQERHHYALSPLSEQEQMRLGIYLRKILAHMQGQSDLDDLQDQYAVAQREADLSSEKILQENESLREIVADLKLELHSLQSKQNK